MVFADYVLIIFWYNGLINNLSMTILLTNFHLHSSFDIECKLILAYELSF